MSLKSLGLDYVDAYLMHWPIAMNPNGNHEKFPKHADGSRDLVLDRSHVDTWLDMEKLLATGKAKSIGVCNYSAHYLNVLLSDKRVKVVPAINQIENHPELPQQEVVDLCREKGIHVTAYSPLGSTGSPLMKNPDIAKVAEKHGVQPANVLLSWHVACGRSVLAKSVNPSRIEQNSKITALDQEDLKALAAVSANGVKRYVYPEFGVNFRFPDKNEGIIVA
jgi:glycerol 2-dehydrogenase (NADP+)